MLGKTSPPLPMLKKPLRLYLCSKNLFASTYAWKTSLPLPMLEKPLCFYLFLLSIFLPLSPALILSLFPIHQSSIPLVLLPKPPLQLQTDSAHKGNSIPHNSVPPIGLHAHSVAAAIWVSPCNIPHTASQASHALPCSINGKAAATKANGSRKQKLNFQDQGMFTGYGDLISRYNSICISCIPRIVVARILKLFLILPKFEHVILFFFMPHIWRFPSIFFGKRLPFGDPKNPICNSCKGFLWKECAKFAKIWGNFNITIFKQYPKGCKNITWFFFLEKSFPACSWNLNK